MKKKYSIANALLWGSAILASEILDAPDALTGLLLPVLAICSILFLHPTAPVNGCQGRLADPR